MSKKSNNLNDPCAEAATVNPVRAAHEKERGKAAKSQARVKEIVAGIDGKIRELFQSERYREYLRVMSRFHQYSLNNTLLIYAQKPDATFCAGFKAWGEKFGRHVKKGEKGITIIAPSFYKIMMEVIRTDPETQKPILDIFGNPVTEEKEIQAPYFKAVKVFDLSQTEGEPLPELAHTLTGDVQQYDIFMEALRRSSPVPIEFVPLPEGTDGIFSREKQSIVIREGMSQAQNVCTIIHEIAHAKRHNKKSSDYIPKDKKIWETEAEAVAFSVLSYYDIDTSANSIPYIAMWSSRDLRELRNSLETIIQTVHELITDIDHHFAEVCKERGIGSENLPESPQQESEAALPSEIFYKMEANPCASGAEDRFLVRSCEVKDGRTLPGETVFSGDAAQCLEMAEKLEAGLADPQKIRKKYVQEHDETQQTDTSEQFAADLYAHLTALKENAVEIRPSIETLQTYCLNELRNGRFNSLRRLLQETAAETGTLNHTFMERLEHLETEWNAGLTYRIRPAYPDSCIDWSILDACKETDGKTISQYSIFIGSMAHCHELKEKLESGAMTIQEVQETYPNDRPALQTEQVKESVRNRLRKSPEKPENKPEIPKKNMREER